jgi:hypothetical protein
MDQDHLPEVERDHFREVSKKYLSFPHWKKDSNLFLVYNGMRIPYDELEKKFAAKVIEKKQQGFI